MESCGVVAAAIRFKLFVGRFCFWYLQYFKIISPLKELPSGGSGKKFISFILNIL